MATQQHPNSVGLSFAELWRRFVMPVKSMTFYAYLIAGIIGAGGFGIWNSIYQAHLTNQWDTVRIAASVYTYFPAIVAASVMELIYDKRPYLRSTGIVASLFFIVVFCVVTSIDPSQRLFWSIVVTILALLFWWAVHGEKDHFNDAAPSDAAIGGSLDKEPRGEIDDFKH